MLAAPTAADPASRLRRVGDDNTSVIFVPPMLAVPLRRHTKHNKVLPENEKAKLLDDSIVGTLVSVSTIFFSTIRFADLIHGTDGFEAA